MQIQKFTPAVFNVVPHTQIIQHETLFTLCNLLPVGGKKITPNTHAHRERARPCRGIYVALRANS